jgi:hypothetical protein
MPKQTPKSPTSSQPAPASNGHDTATADPFGTTVPISSPDDFKRPHPVELASGLSVLIQRVSLYSLVRSGRVPNPLVSAAFAYIEGTLTDKIEEKTEEERTKLNSEYADVRDALVMAIVLDPPLVATWDEETRVNLWVGRIDDRDKDTLIKLAQQPISVLAQFRPGSTSFDVGSDGTALGDDPIADFEAELEGS